MGCNSDGRISNGARRRRRRRRESEVPIVLLAFDRGPGDRHWGNPHLRRSGAGAPWSTLSWYRSRKP